MSASSQAISIAERLSNKTDRQLLVTLVCVFIVCLVSALCLLWSNLTAMQTKFVLSTESMTKAVERGNAIAEANTSVLLQVKTALERK